MTVGGGSVWGDSWGCGCGKVVGGGVLWGIVGAPLYAISFAIFLTLLLKYCMPERMLHQFHTVFCPLWSLRFPAVPSAALRWV